MNVAATAHKSFQIINIIKVIVTTLSVSSCLFVVQIYTHVNLHAHAHARASVCICEPVGVRAFLIVSPYRVIPHKSSWS